MEKVHFSTLSDVVELLNGIPHGVALLDAQLCLMVMNKRLEAMTGYSLDEAAGVYGDYILRSNVSPGGALFQQVLAEGGSVTCDGNIINKDRLKVDVQFTITRIAIAGQPPALMVVLEDLTALRTIKNESARDTTARKEIIGYSSQMEAIFEMIEVLAKTDATVLITGETGTGKDKIAEHLHHLSSRARKPFIKVNCGALPESLLESELFGHEKGAFTGAVKESAGKFRLADQGTIFLTEIGDLSLPLQVKLLSFLDDREFYPLGGNKKVAVDVRVIAATHRALRDEVKKGNFREDLYYRLNVLHLHVPPLRDREGDVRLLLEHFIRYFSTALGRNIEGLSSEALTVLENFPYPGNVRELRNIVEYAVNVCQGKKIQTEDLPPYTLKSQERSFSKENKSAIERTAVVPAVSMNEPAGDTSGLTGWAQIEREDIIRALRQAKGSRSKAAELLGLGRTTLWRKMKKYKLN